MRDCSEKARADHLPFASRPTRSAEPDPFKPSRVARTAADGIVGMDKSASLPPAAVLRGCDPAVGTGSPRIGG